MSVSTENFIKAIYQIKYDEQKKVTSSRIAESLKISSAAVTDMAKKLAAQSLIKYEKYRELELSSKGNKLAVDLIRKHRLWETFLHKVLQMPWDEVHTEAEDLEHSTSERLINKIDAYLNYPEYDPHGDPIPSKTGKLPKGINSKKLALCEPGFYTIVRMRVQSDELAVLFSNYNITLGTEIQLVNRIKADNSLMLNIRNDKMILSNFIAENIYVTVKQ